MTFGVFKCCSDFFWCHLGAVVLRNTGLTRKRKVILLSTYTIYMCLRSDFHSGECACQTCPPRDNHDSRWMLAAATVDLTPKYLCMPQKGKAWLRNGDSTPSRSRKKQSPCGKRPARVLERIGFVEGLESSFLIMALCGNPLMPNYMVWRDSMGLPRVVFG